MKKNNVDMYLDPDFGPKNKSDIDGHVKSLYDGLGKAEDPVSGEMVQMTVP